MLPIRPAVLPHVLRRAALAVLALAACSDARAQDPAPTPGLPSLTPRVFTSTGPARVNLPSIPRQPLTGFGPPPRQYVVPAEREPVEQPFLPPVEALPPLAIAGPAEPVLSSRPRRVLRAEAALGSYLARSGRLDLEAAGESGLFFVSGELDGASPASEYVRSDRLTVRAGGQSYAAGRLRLEGFVTADAYTLPGTAELDRRRRFAAGTTVGVSGLGAVPYDVRAGYTQSRLSGAGGDADEGRFDAEARVGLARDRVRLDATGGVAGVGGDGSSAPYASLGVAYATGRADGARLVIGVRGLLSQAADAGATDTQTLGPILELSLPLSPAVTVFATNTPHLEVRSLAALSALNPVILAGATVAPDVLPVDARAGVAFGQIARVRLYGLATYAPSRLVFERGGGGFYTTSFLRTSTAGVGVDVTVGSDDALSASAGVEARYGRYEFGDVPFFAPLVANASISAPFARGRGRAGVTAHAESKRPDDISGAVQAPAFGLVGFDARYDVGGPFALIARAERLVGTVERWPGFREAPFTAVLGLRLTR